MGQPRVPVGEDGSAKYGQDLSHVRSCPAKRAKITIDRSDKSKSRLANDRQPGRLRDSKIMVDFKILVDRLLNHDRHRFHQDLAPEMEL